METSGLVSLLFSGGTALAGLILVFLGGILNTYELFDAQQRPAVRKKYRRRAMLCYAGFLCALLSALSALGLFWFPFSFFKVFSMVTMLIAFGFVAILATLAVTEV